MGVFVFKHLLTQRGRCEIDIVKHLIIQREFCSEDTVKQLLTQRECCDEIDAVKHLLEGNTVSKLLLLSIYLLKRNSVHVVKLTVPSTYLLRGNVVI